MLSNDQKIFRAKVLRIARTAVDWPSEEQLCMLDDACGEDASLRSEVEFYLRQSNELASTQVLFRSSTSDRYEVIREIGAGGMGRVYLARDQFMKRTVALKKIHGSVSQLITPAQRQTLLARFEVEVEAAGRLEHDNIVKVFDAGVLEEQPFFTMQYVDGPTVDELIASGGTLGEVESAKLVESVARAIHHAHESGIIHRDIKPGNILVDRNSRRVLVTDFGIAKFCDAKPEHTQQGPLGTRTYMSPEQASDASAVTTASDRYSLGATLSYCLYGKVVHERQPPRQRKIPGRANGRPYFEWSERSRDLDVIREKCLSERPNDRFKSAAELANELKRVVDGEPILARPIGKLNRMFRWSMRNPVIAVVSTSAMIALTLSIYFVSDAADSIRSSRIDEQVANSLATQLVAEKATLETENEALAEDYVDVEKQEVRARYNRTVMRIQEQLDLDPESARRLLLSDGDVPIELRVFPGGSSWQSAQRRCELLTPKHTVSTSHRMGTSLPLALKFNL